MKKRNAILLVLSAALLCVSSACQEKYIHVGQNWNDLYSLDPPEKSFDVDVSGKKKAAVGEEMVFEVTSERDGLLWIVQVDPDDEMTMIYPNDAVRENGIRARQKVTIPPAGADWVIEAGRPAGESVLAFIVTTGDTDIRDVLAEFDNSAKAVRVAKRSGWGMRKLVIDTHE